VSRASTVAVAYDCLFPYSTGGGERQYRAFADELAAALPMPVRLVDERLSTVSAHSVLREAGRSQRDSRSIVDQVAAVVLLQQALDVERQSGEPAGPAVSPGQEPA